MLRFTIITDYASEQLSSTHRQLPDGRVVFTKDEFTDRLGGFLEDWAAQEGRIRLPRRKEEAFRAIETVRVGT